MSTNRGWLGAWGAKLFVATIVFAAGLSAPSIGSAASNTPLSQQSAAVAQEIYNETVNCGNGNAGIGRAARDAVTIHVGLAQATPRVDDLFGGDCFASLNQLLDLSSFINAGIWTALVQAARQFIMQWLQNRICTAIQDVTGRAFAPINNAINQLNGLIGGLNGWSNNLNNGNWLNSVLPTKSEEAETRVNPFASKSLVFGGFDPKVDAAQLDAANAAVDRLNKIGALMAQSSTARANSANAQIAYANCLAREKGAGCSREKAEVDQARATADQLNAHVMGLVGSAQGAPQPFVLPRMPQYTPPPATPTAPQAAPPPAAVPERAPQAPASRDQQQPKSEADRMGTLFSPRKDG